MNFGNPFSDYGKIVRGDRFIGRQRNINAVESRIIEPATPGNLAIVGVHRIGKSSLVYKTIIEQKEKLIAKGTLPIWKGVSAYDQTSDFFRSLVDEVVAEMEELGWLTERIQRAAERALAVNASWDRIRRFFREVQNAGYGVVFIFDEFDYARTLFSGETAFQRLRELADYPDYRFSIVLTSRRGIREIERSAGSSSPFHNIFQVQRLTLFDAEDLEIYFSRFSNIGISLSDEARERIRFYSGAHPYLLEMLGWEIVEQFRRNREQRIDVDDAANVILQSLFGHYDDMIRLLREDGTFSKLLQILFGPAVDVTRADATSLENYGLITLAEDGTYRAYAEHFHDYLKLQERSPEFTAELWPIWRDTEKALREIITTTLFAAYGEKWVEQLAEGRSNLKLIFTRCRKAQQKEERSFRDRASRNLIDFTYPADLFTIICAKGLWQPHFQPIFGRDPNYWDHRKQVLAKCRNPLAHNRENILESHELQLIEAYCNEILSLLS